MSRDPELLELRERVHCGVLLEQQPDPWHLDQAESTRGALKYRRGKGEILIISHGGKGWWDPHSEARGDVIALVQHLQPGTSLGLVRKILRPYTGLQPPDPNPCQRRNFQHEASSSIDLSLHQRWRKQPALRRGSATWIYLTEIRRLPEAILKAAIAQDAVRQGPSGSAWFAHRDESRTVCHADIRGPSYKGSLKGGSKTLFRFGASTIPRRLVLAEAAIDALSLAATLGERDDTVYAATGGGMGPNTLAALCRLLASMASLYPDATLVSAVDANRAGARYAVTHAMLAVQAKVRFKRLRPLIEDSDWNAVLQQRDLS
jgi:hypothetical protein